MHTPDALLDTAACDPFVRIDVELVDRLLGFVSRQPRVTHNEMVVATATLTGSPFFAAEGFVTDLVTWPSDRGDATTPVRPLVDALLDLRVALTSSATER
jgi:hypothetical protein